MSTSFSITFANDSDSTLHQSKKRHITSPNVVNITNEDAAGSTNVGARYEDLNQDFYINEEISVERDLPKEQSRADEPYETTLKFRVVGVFDGHSELGEKASRTAGASVVKLLRSIAEQKWKSPDCPKVFDFTDDEIVGVFKQANQNILETYNYAPKTYEYPKHHNTENLSLETNKEGEKFYVDEDGHKSRLDYGTTALICILLGGDRLIVAGVGDSECAIGRQIDGRLHGEYLNEVHNTENPREARRIRKEAPQAEIRSRGYIGATDEECGVIHKLAMTRALGHSYLADFGVIPVPSIKRMTLTGNERFLIVASDGVWDGIDATQAMEFAAGGDTPKAAARRVVEKAVALYPSSAPDNTTAVVVFLH